MENNLISRETYAVTKYFKDNIKIFNKDSLLIIDFLNLDSKELQTIGTNEWLDFLELILKNSHDNRCLKANIFLFAVGLSAEQSDSYKLINKVFQPLYDALEDDKIDYNSWRILENHVPDIGWSNWDKCERVRLALIEAYIKHDWPIEFIFKTI